MQTEILSGEEPPSGQGLQAAEAPKALKEFKSAGRGYWHDVPEKDWNDWHWQLKHRITTVEQLQKFLPTLTPEELAGAKLANHKLALAITPYFFNLIDPADENCPIRLQVIPKEAETQTASWEMSDPCGEDSHSPVPGLVHRYPDRVLFLVTDRCASYCRYCTRSRLVSNASGYDFHPEFDKQIAYIASHPEIRDVLLSGGDPLLFSDEKLEFLLTKLRAIPHVEFLRIGTRIPIFLPQRITPELCAMLKQFHPPAGGRGHPAGQPKRAAQERERRRDGDEGARPEIADVPGEAVLPVSMRFDHGVGALARERGEGPGDHGTITRAHDGLWSAAICD
jgi:lysine 2,3-aminomutase